MWKRGYLFIFIFFLSASTAAAPVDLDDWKTQSTYRGADDGHHGAIMSRYVRNKAIRRATVATTGGGV